MWKTLPADGATPERPTRSERRRPVEHKITFEDGYLSLRDLATYSGLSVSTLRDYVNHLRPPLPHYRIGARIMVRRSEFDQWVRQFREDGSTALEAVADRILASMR